MSTALERVVARSAERRDAVERCGVCATPVPDRHRHLLDERRGAAVCACPACFLLLDRQPSSAVSPYQAIPDRRVRLRPVPLHDLDVPVGLVYVVAHPDGRATAHYPSPLGRTESEVDPATWRAVRERAPALATLRPGVEALLVRGHGRGGPDEQWLVPIDDCFRLVAGIRRNWQGMSGGSAVWTAVARFFDELARTRHDLDDRMEET